MQEPLDSSLAYGVFFVGASVMGMFLMVSVFILVFSQEYSLLNAKMMEKEK